MVFTITDKQSKEKVDLLKALGAEVIVCPTAVEPEDPRSYYSVAKKLAREIPNSYYPNQYAKGEVLLDGGDILAGTQDLNLLRSKIGMVFQKPTPFPMTIYDNIAFGINLYERLPKSEMDERVERALRRAALWDEVKDKLRESGLSLSGGQQQRLCIARTVAIRPEVILLDEPCSALDPISTAKIEELIDELSNEYTIVIVTHNMQQASRTSDYTAFMYLGEIIEFGATEQVFTAPARKQTEQYITGRFG